MSTSSKSSSSRLLVVGTLVLLLGVVMVLVILQSDRRADASAPPVAAPADVPTVEPVADRVTVEQAAEDLGAAVPTAIRIDSYDPVDVREGYEAVAVKVPYDRAVASLPFPGDRVRVYRLPTAADMDTANPVDQTAAAAPAAAPTMPPANPPAELVMEAVDVLAVIGPPPASNAETDLTLVLEVKAVDVPQVLQLANDGEIWTSLLPRPADGATS